MTAVPGQGTAAARAGNNRCGARRAVPTAEDERPLSLG